MSIKEIEIREQIRLEGSIDKKIMLYRSIIKLLFIEREIELKIIMGK
jgi:hypothetical protein